MIYLLALATPIWWFWVVDTSLPDAVFTTVGLAGGWYSYRMLLLKKPELFANKVAILLLLTCSIGTAVGISAIIFRHLL